MTTLGELRHTYAEVHRDFNSTAYNLSVAKRELKERIESTPDGEKLWGKQSATLNIQYDAVKEKLDEYNSFIQEYMEQWDSIFNKTANENNSEAAKDYYDDLQKIITVARRMSKGDLVPASDEKKLMEYDDKLYMMAKNAQMLAELEKRKKHDSLWEDEEKKEYPDPIEEADNTPTDIQGPEIYTAEEVMSSAVTESGSPLEGGNIDLSI